MSDNRRESLKNWMRMLRDLRTLRDSAKIRNPFYVDPDEAWRRRQERWEIEAELDREDEAKAAEARQQEAVKTPEPTAPPEAEILVASKPKLRKATDEEVEAALLEVYEPLGEGNGPNVNDVVKPTQKRLEPKGLKRSWDDIVDIAGREKFNKFRGRVGARRSQNSQS
jgi:hypothetical protein